MQCIIDIANFRILNNELLNKDTYFISTRSRLIILDSKPDVCMDKNAKNTKHNIAVSRRMHLLRYIRDNNNLVQ